MNRYGRFIHVLYPMLKRVSRMHVKCTRTKNLLIPIFDLQSVMKSGLPANYQNNSVNTVPCVELLTAPER